MHSADPRAMTDPSTAAPPARTTSRGMLFRIAVLGAGAAVLYGGWALWANHGYGLGRAGRAAVVQAAWSFSLTAVLAAINERSVRRVRASHRPLPIAALPGLALIWIGPVTVHELAGTPAVAATIAPGVTIGTLFVATHVAALGRLLARQERA